MTRRDDPITVHRGRLLGLAYRMLASRSDAEDVLQDAYLRWHTAKRDDIHNSEAFLVTTVTRLCLDRIKSARAKRERYVGTWLPEPVLDLEALSPHTSTELSDDLSFALLLALQRLTPAERATFLLHDVFDMDFAEIARILERPEAACRQLASRARRAVRSNRSKQQASAAEHRRLLEAFTAALASGDITQVTALLKDDVVSLADGGGIKTATSKPVYGAKAVARLFLGLVRRAVLDGTLLRTEQRAINGAPGLLIYLGDELEQTFSLEIEDSRVAKIYAVRNPRKLAHIAGMAEQRKHRYRCSDIRMLAVHRKVSEHPNTGTRTPKVSEHPNTGTRTLKVSEHPNTGTRTPSSVRRRHWWPSRSFFYLSE